MADLLLDIWFCGQTTALLKEGPSAAVHILLLVKNTLELLPQDLPAAAKPHMRPQLESLQTMCMCMAQMCRPVPGTFGSSVDDVLRVFQPEGGESLWLATFRGILETPGSPWHEVMTEVLRTAASTKQHMKAYNDCCAVAINKDASFKEIAASMFALAKIKEAMRAGATRKLEKSMYERLRAVAQTLLDTPPEPEVTSDFGASNVQDLLKMLGMLRDHHEGCEGLIEDVRKFAGRRKATLALTDLKDFGKTCMDASHSGQRLQRQ